MTATTTFIAQDLRPGWVITDASGAEYTVDHVELGGAPKGARIQGRWARIFVEGKPAPHLAPAHNGISVVRW